jgi:8-oxo-dGTP pyrophosphatase MutT (NUDIX family)
MKSKRVAVAIVRDENDNVLFGIRKDCGKYVNPSGKAEKGEDIYQACIRELKEETGLDALDLKLVKVGYKTEKKMMVYIFDVKVDRNQKIDPSNDPDEEADVWAYLDPNDIIDQLHVPIEENWGLHYWAKS